MAYPYYNPYQVSQPVNGLVSVNGMNGAQAYPLPPNSQIALFDENEDKFYVKKTDSAGFPTVVAYTFEAAEHPAPVDTVSREEFDKLVAAVEALGKGGGNGEQPVPKAAE